jgi:hypothetical protein
MKYLFVMLLLCVTSINLHGQEVRVNNSFIILINDELAKSPAGVHLTLTDRTGKAEVIQAGYYPGVLYVDNTETKNVLFGDSTRILTLSFDVYRYKGDNTFINNYKINIERRWFKESLMILKIYDLNQSRNTYKYTFEIPGVYFSIKTRKKFLGIF